MFLKRCRLNGYYLIYCALISAATLFYCIYELGPGFGYIYACGMSFYFGLSLLGLFELTQKKFRDLDYPLESAALIVFFILAAAISSYFTYPKLINPFDLMSYMIFFAIAGNFIGIGVKSKFNLKID